MQENFFGEGWASFWLTGELPFSASGGNFPHHLSRENPDLYTYPLLPFTLFKWTTYLHTYTYATFPIYAVWFMLFFQSALIPQLCLQFFQKLKYNN